MSDVSRRIAHVDMDAFYASVELLRYPELKGHPVVIGGRSIRPGEKEGGVHQFVRLRDYAGRGVVTTSTYEARHLGVFSAMGLMKAAQLAPDAILLPADFEAYRHYSRLFKAAVASIAPDIEDRGIDEIYVDLSHHAESTMILGQAIKAAVLEATGLSCSIGVAANKLLAKICSDLEKPNGLTILSAPELETRIWPLPAKKINGVGPKATEKLASLGIISIRDLAHADLGLLQQHFGRTYSEWLHRAAHGLDDREVATRSEPKSMSRETTFERNLHARADRHVLGGIFTDLCVRLAEDLRRKGYVARTVGVKLRYSDFQIVTRDITLTVSTSDAATIRRAAAECVRRAPLTLPLRLLGVRASALTPGLSESESAQTAGPGDQGELFE